MHLDHLERLSATGDPLEALGDTVDFEVFRPVLIEALGYGERPKGGRPPYDAVTMFKVLVLASMHTLSDERMEFLIRDRFCQWHLKFPQNGQVKIPQFGGFGCQPVQ